jgi:HD superfamily phosphohydrolase
MAMSYLVYPGAVHSRLHHAIGAYHLMHNALYELKQKGIAITPAEEQGAKIAILLHDIGHGPFSHALEYMLVKDLEHEAISEMIMEVLNEEFNGALSTAIDIFLNVYPKKFLHQLVSGQLDVDRMDYLTRDSFFSGVVEGMIGCDRILKMLTVHEGESKAISPQDAKAIESGKYFFQRPLFQYYKKSSYQKIKPFLDFEKSKSGTTIIQQSGYYPVKK